MRALVRDDVLVVDFPQQGDLPDGGAGQSFVLDLDQHLLDGHILIGLEIESLVDEAVGALAWIDADLPMLSSFL